MLKLVLRIVCKGKILAIKEFVLTTTFIKKNKSFKNVTQDTRSEVLTAIVMKFCIIWDIKSCSSVNVYINFGGICRLYLQGKK
jgi:hypothetical protein